MVQQYTNSLGTQDYENKTELSKHIWQLKHNGFSSANKASQLSITANLQSLTAHIYCIMIIVTSGFSKKSFFLILFVFCFLEIYLNNLEIVFLEFKYIYNTQRTSLFSFYLFIFYCCLVIILCINTSHHFVLFH